MKPGLLLVLLLLLTGCTEPKNSPATAPYFREMAQSAGLTYQWTPPQKTPLNLRETIGNGAAFLDFDADGNLDILLVGAPCVLFRGDGKGKLTPSNLPCRTNGVAKPAIKYCAVSMFRKIGGAAG